MSTKDKTINLRVTGPWLTACEEGASRISASMPVGSVSRNAFIEHAVTEYLKAQGWDDLAALSSRQ